MKIANNTELAGILKDKNILYIATKNADYIRLQQEIRYVNEYAAKSTILVSAQKNYFFRCAYVFFKLLFTPCRQYDLVFVGFMAQMIVPLFGWKFRRSELVVDFFVSVYDTMMDDREAVKKGSWLGGFFHRMDSRTLKRADYIIADTQAHGQYFKEEFNVPDEKLYVLYLEADRNFYYPMEVERPREWKDKFLVLYFGSILPLQGIETIMQAVQKLRDEENIHFIIIGPVGKKTERAEGNNVSYIDWLPQKELAQYVAMADLCLAGHFNPNIGKAHRTIAGKTYIYQAMNKRIILGDGQANRELFPAEDSYISYVPMGDPGSLADKVRSIYRQDRQLQEK